MNRLEQENWLLLAEGVLTKLLRIMQDCTDLVKQVEGIRQQIVEGEVEEEEEPQG